MLGTIMSEILTRSRGDGGGGRDGVVILLGLAPDGVGGTRCVWEVEADVLCDAEDAMIAAVDEPLAGLVVVDCDELDLLAGRVTLYKAHNLGMRRADMLSAVNNVNL